MARRHRKTRLKLTRAWVFWPILVAIIASVAAVAAGGWQASERVRIKDATVEICREPAQDVSPAAKSASMQACEKARKEAASAPLTLDNLGNNLWRATYSVLIAVVGDYYFLDFDRFEHRPSLGMKVGSLVLMCLTLTWAYQVLAHTLGVTLSVLRCRWLGFDTLVIGNTFFARRAARLLSEDRSGWRRRSVVIAFPEPSATGQGLATRRFNHALHLALPFDPLLLDEHLPLAKAKGRILIDVGSSAENLAVLRGVARILGPTPKAEIICQMEDDHLTDEAHHLLKDSHFAPVFINMNRIAATAAFASAPLYELAHAAGQPQVHLLLVGFGKLGQVMLEEALLGSVAGNLGRPRVTVLDVDSVAVKKRLERDYPALALVADVEVISINPLEALRACVGNDCLLELLAAEEHAPLTAIALALPRDAENIECALLLRRYRLATGRLAAMIYMPERTEASICDLLDNPDWAESSLSEEMQERLRIVALRDDELVDLLAPEVRRDADARQIHAEYLKSEGRSALASGEWERLPETARRSNRRAANHVAAKKWSLALDLEKERNAVPALAAGEEAGPLTELLTQCDNARRLEILTHLATLEHMRWMVDRVIDGWRLGAEDNNALKLRRTLVVFDQLLHEDKEKDFRQVELVLGLPGNS